MVTVPGSRSRVIPACCRVSSARVIPLPSDSTGPPTVLRRSWHSGNRASNPLSRSRAETWFRCALTDQAATLNPMIRARPTRPTVEAPGRSRVAADPLGHPPAERRLGGVLERLVVEEPAEVLGEVAGAGVAPVGVGVEALADHGVEVARDAGVRPTGARARPPAAPRSCLGSLPGAAGWARVRANGRCPAIISKRISPRA